jgi:hypothetical protein
MPVELQPPNEEGMVRTAVVSLAERFDAIDSDRIEETVRRSVDELYGQARVKSFVGIIAERRAREELRRPN